MTEWIHLAFIGWRSYIAESKAAALFIAAILLLCFLWKKVDRKQFVIYSAAAAVLLICPLTAAFGLLYQTRFYDYEWLWSGVPTVALTADAVVLLLEELAVGKDKKSRLRLGVVVAILLTAVFLSGLSEVSYDPKTDEVLILPSQKEMRAEAADVLKSARSALGEGKMILAAPADILTWARELDSTIELLYGRNMWDKHLNAYTYDTYPNEYETLYLFIEGQDREKITAETAAGILADQTSVNCLILRGTETEETIALFTQTLHMTAAQWEGYYILTRP